MMSRTFRFLRTWIFVLAVAAVMAAAAPATNAAAGALPGQLPIPRFVFIKDVPGNVRVGPGRSYKIRWRYLRRDVPVEIYQEFGNWRRIRGADGQSGWIHRALLSGRRTAIVAPWLENPADFRKEPVADAAVLARLERGVLLSDLACEDEWCHGRVEPDISGYIRHTKLWGVYPGEVFGAGFPTHWGLW
jgi:SH3-like domain-containing protein